MRELFCKRSCSGLLLAALTAGTIGVPAGAAQNGAGHAKKPANKSAGASTPHTTKSATTKKSTKSSGGKSSSGKRSRRVKGQAAPTTERISEIQDALARKGAYSGSSTGKMDDSTVQALKKFQASNGLSPSGKLDAPTLQRLGLGSETAGLAAPTPPPNSANRLKNTASLPSEPSE